MISVSAESVHSKEKIVIYITTKEGKRFRLTGRSTQADIQRRLQNPNQECVYAVHSPWWSLFEDEWMPYRCPGTRIPCDPRGSVLMQGNLRQFWDTAIGSPEHYGRHGINAFMLAFHGNLEVLKAETLRYLPTSLDSWDAYNDLLDMSPSGTAKT